MTGNEYGIPRLECCQLPLANDVDQKQDEERTGECPTNPRGPVKRCTCQRAVGNVVPVQSLTFSIEQDRSWLDDLSLNHAVPLITDLQVDSGGEFDPTGKPPCTRSGRKICLDIQSWRC